MHEIRDLWPGTLLKIKSEAKIRMKRGVLCPQMEPKHSRNPNGDDGEVAELNE